MNKANINSNKIKIFIASYSLGIGGVEKALLGLLNSLDYEKCQVDLLLMIPEGELIDQINPNVNLLSTPAEFQWINIQKGCIMSSVHQLLKRPRLLCVYLKNLFQGIVTKKMTISRQLMWKAASYSLPKVKGDYDYALDFSGSFRRYIIERIEARHKYTWIHSDFRVMGFNNRIEESILSQYDGILCVSKTCKEIFDELFPTLAHKTHVELNRIDIKLINQMAASGKGFDDGFTGIRLLDVTRIDPNKGLDIAVQVCSKLKASGIKFRWYILGNDPLGYKKTLESLIAKYDVEQEFILLGFTSNPYPYMMQADIIVHFSRFEGKSVALDEALALGKTILVTDYPTAKDQITDGINGHICKLDIYELTSKLTRLLTRHDK